MGIGYFSTKLFLRERAARPFSGRILQLGRQEVTWRHPEYVGLMNDESFFRWLGFSEVHSCDVSDYERPTFVFDLNKRAVASIMLREQLGSYSVIHDGGTLEHVFHLPNALANIHDMLKVGGRIIHINPASNYIDHGFYSFSPTFFWDYYEANGYRVEECCLVAQREVDGDSPRLYRYTPGCVTRRSRGWCSSPEFAGLDVWDNFFVATKLEGSTSGVVPQQRRCVEMWNKKKQPRQELEFLGVL